MSLVDLRRADGVACLTLDRPAMQNALVPELLDDLLAQLRGLAADDACRVVVLQARGEAFSIGGDMRRFRRERAGDLAAYASGLVGRLNEAILALIDLPQPVVAAVHGLVTGGSLGLVLAADQIVLAEDAVFKSHYVSAGFAPDGGWTALLPRLIGRQRTAAALLQNRTLQAADALAWGLVGELAPAAEVQARAAFLAGRIAGRPQGTVRAAKRLLWRERDAIAADLEAERRAFVGLVAGPEATAGVEDFLAAFSSYPDDEGVMPC